MVDLIIGVVGRGLEVIILLYSSCTLQFDNETVSFILVDNSKKNFRTLKLLIFLN